MTVLQVKGPTVAVIHFDPTKVSALRREQIEHVVYHLTRLLTGERTAVSEWKHLGIAIDCEPDTDQGDEA